MPLPSPKKNEKDKEFISRCAGDDTMNKEFPETSQRLGVCYNILKRAKKRKAKAEVDWDEVKSEIMTDKTIII